MIYYFIFILFFLTMSGSDEALLYKKGLNKELDEKVRMYKKISVWSGPAISEALTDEEIKIMVTLWRKEKQTPWKLSVQDVSTLVAGLFFFVWELDNINTNIKTISLYRKTK